jgi:hypothetical protein
VLQVEDQWGEAFLLGEEGFVEEGDDGQHFLEVFQDFGDEFWGGGEGGIEFAPEVPLLAFEQVDGGVIGGEALWGAGECFALEIAHQGGEGLGLEQSGEAFVVFEQVCADEAEVVRAGHIDAAGDADVFFSDLEVEGTGVVLVEGGMVEEGAGVGFIGGFVRGKAGVAVDAEDGAAGFGGVGWVEAAETGGDGGGEVLDRLFEGGEIAGLVGVEPFAIIVGGEVVEEELGIGGQSGEGGFRHGPSPMIEGNAVLLGDARASRTNP